MIDTALYKKHIDNVNEFINIKNLFNDLGIYRQESLLTEFNDQSPYAFRIEQQIIVTHELKQYLEDIEKYNYPTFKDKFISFLWSRDGYLAYEKYYDR